MRGEKKSPMEMAMEMHGSPPHARGKESYDAGNLDAGRITPACAGKSLVIEFPRHFNPDHPRMRGEKAGVTTAVRDAQGSPPHARGKVSFACL